MLLFSLENGCAVCYGIHVQYAVSLREMGIYLHVCFKCMCLLYHCQINGQKT